MKFSPQIYKAINTAARLHDGQVRKGDGLPYIVHPVSVALILMEHTNDEEVLIAGILHDTIEDTGYTKEQMEEEFGTRVTQLVLDVTELPKPLSWQERKDAYLEHLEGASHEAKLICAADKLHNLQSMLAAVEKFGDEAYEHFNAPMDKKLWFYEECVKILKNDKEIPVQMIDSLEAVLEKLRRKETIEAMMKHPAEIIDSKDYINDATIKCPICGWSDKAKNGNKEYFDDLFHIECPKCEKMILIVQYPLIKG